jgi:UDP-N-acetylmuramyl pentapeptide synthase
MAAAMKVLRTIGPADGRTVLILGDMLELGRSAEFEHKLLGRAAALMDVGLLVAVGPMCRHTAAAAREAGLDADRALWFPDAEEAAPWVAQHLQPQDRVLIKGSRGMRMERVRRALEGAGKD